MDTDEISYLNVGQRFRFESRAKIREEHGIDSGEYEVVSRDGGIIGRNMDTGEETDFNVIHWEEVTLLN